MMCRTIVPSGYLRMTTTAMMGVVCHPSADGTIVLDFRFDLLKGGLAQLARALAWHARGHRFDSDILHFFQT